MAGQVRLPALGFGTNCFARHPCQMPDGKMKSLVDLSHLILMYISWKKKQELVSLLYLSIKFSDHTSVVDGVAGHLGFPEIDYPCEWTVYGLGKM